MVPPPGRKRARKAVARYTDDNPSTFTTKEPKSSSNPLENDDDDEASVSSEVEKKRGPGRPRGRPPKHKNPPSRGVGRPPKKKKALTLEEEIMEIERQSALELLQAKEGRPAASSSRSSSVASRRSSTEPSPRGVGRPPKQQRKKTLEEEMMEIERQAALEQLQAQAAGQGRTVSSRSSSVASSSRHRSSKTTTRRASQHPPSRSSSSTKERKPLKTNSDTKKKTSARLVPKKEETKESNEHNEENANEKETEGGVLVHALTVRPVLPPPLLDPLLLQSQLRQRNASRTLGSPPVLPAPRWHPSVTSRPPAPLLEDPIVCCSSSSSSSTLLAVGHASGRVTIYGLGGLVRPLVCVEETAAHLRHLSTSSGIHAPKRTIHFLNSLTHISVNASYVVVATSQEVECWNVQPARAVLVWRYPCVGKVPRVVLKLDLEPLLQSDTSSSDCLVSWMADPQQQHVEEEPHCLWMLRAAKDDEGATTPEETEETAVTRIVLPEATHQCLAVHDRSTRRRLLVLAETTPQTDTHGIPQQELWLVQRPVENDKEEERTHIVARTVIPSRSHTKATKLSAVSQSPGGCYTCVASTRGIRLYKTDTLDLLQVHGENVVLHGKPLQWQDAILIPTWNKIASKEDKGEEHGVLWNPSEASHTVQHLDELEYRETHTTCLDETQWMVQHHATPPALIVGVPQANKEPLELHDTLHFWQWNNYENASGGGAQAAHAIAGPHKSGGLLPHSVVYHNHNLLCVTMHRGELHQMTSAQSSDFGGVMYPPGYRVVEDNIEYIEDEDEVDVVVVTEDDELDDEDAPTSIHEDDFAEAMRRSMEELATEKSLALDPEDAPVDVGNKADERLQRAVTIPCHPEARLREELQQRDGERDSSDADALVHSPKKKSPSDLFTRRFLKAFPQLDKVRLAQRKIEERPPLDELVGFAPMTKQQRGKKSRNASLDAIIKASVNPALRKLMFSKESWAGGEGSTLREADRRACMDALADGSLVLEKIVEKPSAPVDGTVSPQISETEEDLSKKIASAHVDDAAAAALEGMFALRRSNSEDCGASPSKKKRELPVMENGPLSTDSTEISPTGEAVTVSEAIESEKVQKDIIVTTPASDKAGSAIEADKPVVTNDEGSEPSSLARGGGGVDGENTEVPIISTQSTLVSVSEASTPQASSAPGESQTTSRSTSADMHANVASDEQAETKESSVVTPEPSLCDACLGRMVVHSCGKKEIPIDFEAIARAEKEKREREEEEKKRLRMEKRRLADVKRREAKRKKKQEEERKKQEELERQRVQIEEMERERLRAEEQRRQDEVDKDRRRAELWQRLMQTQEPETNSQYEAAPAQPSFHTISHYHAAPMPAQPHLWQQNHWEGPQHTNSIGNEYAEAEPHQNSYQAPTFTNTIPSYSELNARMSSPAPDRSVTHGFSSPTAYHQTASAEAPDASNQSSLSVNGSTSILSSPILTGSSYSRTNDTSRTGDATRNSGAGCIASSTDETAAPPPKSPLERATSAQIGTAEVLASLANGFFSMAPAPAPEPAPAPAPQPAQPVQQVHVEEKNEPAVETYSSSQESNGGAAVAGGSATFSTAAHVVNAVVAANAGKSQIAPEAAIESGTNGGHLATFHSSTDESTGKAPSNFINSGVTVDMQSSGNGETKGRVESSEQAG